VVLPSSCPWHDDGEACDVRRHSARVRKCGPEYALTVSRCWTHGRFFTLYPPGWTPYGREPVEVRRAASDGATTVLSAALSVASAPSLRALSGYRRTLGRKIVRAALWLGVVGESGESVAAVLGMDLHAHVARRRAYARASTWRDRAQLGAEALAAIERTAVRWQRLLVAGYHAGLCGRPWLTDPRSGVLVPLVQ